MNRNGERCALAALVAALGAGCPWLNTHPPPNGGPDGDDVGPKACEAIRSCRECVLTYPCGMCDGRCVSGDEGGPDVGSCGAWTYDVLECADATDGPDLPITPVATCTDADVRAPSELAGTMAVTESGVVVGADLGDLVAFKGIPYAAPPVGPLRFRPPSRVTPWSQPRDATQFGSACAQALPFPTGSEDCLFLNVWAHRDGVPRPVMVFIHGGAFSSGSSDFALFDGAALARSADVTVVTINYRVSTLGFLAIDELLAESGDGSVGNYGVRDQIAALDWVRRNIAGFGGDPCAVTIFGESAGGDAVCILLTSPLSQGLFHGAIVESGMCRAYPRLHEPSLFFPAANDFGRGVLERVGCADAADRVACLRSKPAGDLVSAVDFTSAWMVAMPVTPPTIDGVVILDDPVKVARRGQMLDVPTIVGTNANEGGPFALMTPTFTPLEYEIRMRLILPEPLASRVLQIYPWWRFGSPQAAQGTFLSDVMFVCPGVGMADAVSIGSEPGYTYHLTHQLDGLLGLLGAAHTLELFFVFDALGMVPGYAPTAADRALVATMQHAWGTFARSGVPDVAGGWPAHLPSHGAFLELGPGGGVRGEIREGRCDALRELGLVP